MKIPETGQPVLRLRKGGITETGGLRIPRQTPAETSDWKRTETTRYLCAAAHLDDGFRKHVLRTLLVDKHRAIAISYGVDIPTVLKHCLVARRRKRIRNWLVALAVLLGGFMAWAAAPDYAFIGAIVYLLVSWFAIFAEQVVTKHNTVRLKLTRDHFDPDCVSYPERLDIASELSDGRQNNVMVYSGFSPFVGAGVNLGGWSFAVDIAKGKQELGRMIQTETFEVRDLYLEICSALSHLGLASVAIEDKLCVNGQDIRGDARFLPDLLGRPNTIADQSVVDEIRDNPTASVRYYKQIRVVDWNGELVLNMFLRFAKVGHSLFVESTSCVLTPIHERYQKKVNAMSPEAGAEEWIEMGLTSLVYAVVAWAIWPLWLLAKLTGVGVAREHRHQIRKTIRKDPTFDRGALTSIREFAGSPVYQRYFQKLDKDMYVKVLQQQITDIILRFLDARGIDTTDLKERQTSIVNSGVFVSGDLSLQAEAVALGAQAKAIKTERSHTAS